MKYEKPPLTFEQQADRLIQRGLIANRDFLIDRLKNVNYYRLSGYLYPYRQSESSDTFKPDTTFEKVWRRYTFDRRLRLIVMDAVERVEVSVRTQLIYALAHESGAFGYTSKTTLSNLSDEEYFRLVEELKGESEHSREKFVEHFKNKYGDQHPDLPLWIVGEIMSFGCMLTMYRGASDNIKRTISAYYGIPAYVLTSWLKTINVLRNICAHHGRLWNRILGFRPLIPRENKYPQWHRPVEIPQDRIFGVLTILRYLLKIMAPNSKWKHRFLSLLEEYPEISRWSMGFSDNWQESLLWKDE